MFVAGARRARPPPERRVSSTRALSGGADVKRPIAVDAGTPDLERLRQKYLGRGTASVQARPDATQDEDAIVSVEPEEVQDPRDRAQRTKSVVVSGRAKRIVGRQG
jgi:hypothetical protein